MISLVVGALCTEKKVQMNIFLKLGFPPYKDETATTRHGVTRKEAQ